VRELVFNPSHISAKQIEESKGKDEVEGSFLIAAVSTSMSRRVLRDLSIRETRIMMALVAHMAFT
jgi:hypothetical protein